MWRETHVRAMINKNVPRVASADAAYFCFGRWAGIGEGWGAKQTADGLRASLASHNRQHCREGRERRRPFAFKLC